MKKRQDVDDPISRLDPEVAALVRACKVADEDRQARNRGLDWLPDGRPTELNLKFGPMTLLCLGAGVLSAAGGLVIFSWPDANVFHLLISQLPAAGIISYVAARKPGRADGSRRTSA